MGINVAKSLDREKIEEIRTLREINSMREDLNEGNFKILPLEMVLNIISFLGHSDVAHLCALNWSWNLFIERSPCIWKGLYAKYFDVEFFKSSKRGIAESSTSETEHINWKKVFRDAFHSEDKWNTCCQRAFPDVKMRENNAIVYLKSGCEWCTCRLGSSQFPSPTDRIRTFSFRIKSAVGTMIGLAEASWRYTDCYPGRGFYGVSVNNPYEPKAASSGPNGSILSIALYEEFQQNDLVSMKVDSAEKTVTFYKNQTQVAEPVSWKAHQQPLIPLCGICGPGSCVEVLSFRSPKSGDIALPNLLPKRRKSSIFNFFEIGAS